VVGVNTIQTQHIKTHNKQTKWKKTNPKNQITNGTAVTHMNTEQRWRASNA